MLQREHLIIRYWLRTNLTPEEIQTAQQLKEAPLNWDYVIRLLERNSVVSFFAYNTRHLPEVSTNTTLNTFRK